MWQWLRCRGASATAGAVGLIVAVGVGVAVASMPDSAGGPKARAASPVATFAAERASGPSNAAPGPSFTPVLRLRVRRGLFAVNAKVVIITSAPRTGSDCSLRVDGSEVDSSNQPQFNPSVTSRTTHPLQFAGRVRRLITLHCRAGERWSASDAKITAIRLTSLTK
jgi:hypothetical protein